jgi:protein-disulfide isomerase
MENEITKEEVKISQPSSTKLTTPMAVIVAGVIIAVAIFTSNSKVSNPKIAPSGNQPQQAVAPQPTGDVTKVRPVDPNTDHIKGNKNAKIFLIEYSDFECPFCKRFHPTTQQVLDQYQGKVALVYRHYPLSFHANAEKEAEATECANEQGGNDAFWKYADKIFERTTSNGTGFPLDKLVPLAKEIGLDGAKFKSCLDSGKYAQHIQDDEKNGQDAGVTGTPGNIVWTANGKPQLVEGAVPFENLKSVIDQYLK